MPRKSKGPFLRWRKDRNVFEIIHHTGGRRIVHSTGTSDSAIAQKALSDYIIGQSSRRVGPCHPHERLIADVISEYLTKHAAHVANPETAAYTAEALLRYWGNLTAGDVRAETARAYETHRQREWKAKGKDKPLSPNTIRRELATLAAALKHDFMEGNLTQMIPVKKPAPVKIKERWLTHEEADALLEKSESHIKSFIMMGLYTGARKSAILSLRWPQVDLVNGLIDFNPPGRAKTTKGRSLIPIPRELLTHLKELKKRGTDLGYVIHINQRPIGDIKKGFRKACDDSKLIGVTPHTLRHTCASWMAQKGIPFPEIARYLGHRDSRTTEQIYAHFNPNYLRGAAESFKRGGK